MPDASVIEAVLRNLTPDQLRDALASLVPAHVTRQQRIAEIEKALNSPAGPTIRDTMGQWIVEHIVPARALVPETYTTWVPIVRDAMLFVVTHLSAARLAPKLLEQLELPPQTHAEKRLLVLISRVPGLQKLGQVVARNRHLRAPLRRALTELENSIRDVDQPALRAILRRELGSRLAKYKVTGKLTLLSEASVSAILRFGWTNPETGRRERGVFKVRKPYISTYFAEDMQLLQGLADLFGSRLHVYGIATDALSDTFTKVRRLLEHEVNFRGEQATLLRAESLYDAMPGVRTPRLIPQLSSDEITAMTYEPGRKITSAAASLSAWQRKRLAEKLVEAIVVVPLFAGDDLSLFHADPHAGNLLYDEKTQSIILLDWALTERLSREQRRQLALLLFMVGLRDPIGTTYAVEALRERRRGSHRRSPATRRLVTEHLDSLPWARLPSAVDAMRLLEKLALKGYRFPAPLIMLSKVLFTLDGILYDLGASDTVLSVSVMRHLARQFVTHPQQIGWHIKKRDWFALQSSALLYPGRLFTRLEGALIDRILPPPSN